MFPTPETRTVHVPAETRTVAVPSCNPPPSLTTAQMRLLTRQNRVRLIPS